MSIFAKVEEREVSVSGSISEGFLSASIKNTGNQEAIVNGVSLAIGEAKSYPFVGKGYEKVDYDPKGTRLRILEIF